MFGGVPVRGFYLFHFDSLLLHLDSISYLYSLDFFETILLLYYLDFSDSLLDYLNFSTILNYYWDYLLFLTILYYYHWDIFFFRPALCVSFLFLFLFLQTVGPRKCCSSADFTSL